MNKLLLATTLALPSFAFAHGGTYRGPQDTVPPSGGGGGSGGGGRATPGPAQPGGPGPGQPPTPGAVTPGVPGGNPGGPARPTGGGDGASDLSAWQFWWAFNKDPFLNLKSHLHSAVVTGSGEYYLGHGERDQAKDMLLLSESMIREKIVPRLLHALRTEQSNDIQSSCMIALAKIGDEQGEDGSSVIAKEIAAFLTSGSQELSETAAVALGILGNPAAIDLLSALVSNDAAELRRQGIAQNGAVSMRTRAFAAYGLGLIGCKASDEQRLVINATLRKLLDGEGRQMAQRDIPVACLTSIGLTPLPAVAGQAGSDGKLGEVLRTREDQLRYLLGYYEDEANNFLTRAHAPTAMARLLATGDGEVGALRDEVAVALMHSLSKDSRDQDAMKQSCALALGLFGDADEDPTDKAIRAALMRVKDDLRDRQVRHFALIALGQVAGRPGEGAGDPIHAVNTVKKQENARTFLLGELAKDKNGIAPWAGLALAMLERSLDEAKLASSPDAKLALRGALHDAKSPDDIGAFAIASGLVRDVGALGRLLENLDVGDPEARGYTAVGLGLLGEKSAMPKIRDLVNKSKYQADVLKSAAIGLGLLGDKKLVPELIEMLSSSTALSSQAAVSSALGFIGDARSVDPLIALLENQQATGLARAFGAVALGIISDKEDFPWNSKIGVGSNYRANTPSLTDQKGGILDIL